MRLFVAIELPESLLPEIENLQFKLRGRGLVRARHPHLTLKFIGEIQDPQPIISALSEIRFSTMSLTIRDIGFFPDVSKPNVVFLGVKPNPALDELAANVRSTLPEYADDHPFHAHLTLFRLRQGFHKARLKDVVRHVKLKEIRFDVNEFVLKRSVLTPNGPEYSDVARFPAKDL